VTISDERQNKLIVKFRNEKIEKVNFAVGDKVHISNLVIQDFHGQKAVSSTEYTETEVNYNHL